MGEFAWKTTVLLAANARPSEIFFIAVGRTSDTVFGIFIEASLSTMSTGGCWLHQKVENLKELIQNTVMSLNESWNSIDYGNSHFIFLDTAKENPTDISPDSEQYKWLVQDLNSDSYKNATWCFVFFHHPIWSGAGPVVSTMEKFYYSNIWFLSLKNIIFLWCFKAILMIMSSAADLRIAALAISLPEAGAPV